MDLLRDRLLARTALAKDQHTRIRELRNAVDPLLQSPHLRRLSDQLPTTVAAVVSDCLTNLVAPRLRADSRGQVADRRRVQHLVLIIPIGELCRFQQLAIVTDCIGHLLPLVGKRGKRLHVNREELPDRLKERVRLANLRL